MEKLEESPLGWEKEIWKPVIGYEGRYEVSTFGRVKSLDAVRVGRIRNIYSKPERILTPKVLRTNYCLVQLVGADGVINGCSVHRLVAQAFIPNPNGYPVVNHKDEDKQNNCVWNLEWCTRSYNTNYGTRNERVSQKLRESRGFPIMQYSKAGAFLKEWKNAASASRELGISLCAIRDCVKGRTKTSGGFIWKQIV